MSNMTPEKPAKKLTPRQRKAKQAAREGGYIDRNYDFLPDPDTLSVEELAADYGLAYNIITQDDELLQLFNTAFNDRGAQWSDERFKLAVQGTEWYKKNNQYYREAWLAKAKGDADWNTLKENARLAITAAATQAGVKLDPNKLDSLSEEYLFGGWDKPGRENLLQQALVQTTGDISATPETDQLGQMGNIAEELNRLAYYNGVNYNDAWYQAAARSVQAGLSTKEDWERDIIEKSAGMFPVFAKQIQAGMTAYDAASPYIKVMADTFELAPSSISLNDPYIRGALGGFSPDGQPEAMNLGDFQRKLRNDPRWKETDQAQNEITGVAGRIMQMFGLMGG